ncbi:MAG: S-layer homology domain-containing protein, partial [Oscillospiraceae bacterium]|nr:S-layer homology domain-containing protein [Oscillospiraceae bacterium]
GPPVYVPGDNGEPGDYERPNVPEDTDEEPVNVEQLLPPVIAKTSSYTAPLRVGDDVTYTLTLTNPNAVALNNRLIVDNLANGALAADLATVTVTPTTALVGTPAIVDGRLELVVNIPANGAVVTFDAEVLQTGTVTNLGSVYGPPVYVPGDNGEPGDYERPNVPEDTDEEPVDVEQLLPPVIAKTSEYTAPLRVGDDVTYTLTLTNPNAVALNNRLIVDNLANGALAADLATVVVTPATALVGTPAIVDGRLELVVNIPANGVTVTFEAEVLQPGTVTNLGSVYGPPVYVPGDNGEPGDYERPDEPEDTDEEPVDVEQLLPPVIAKTSSYTAPLRVGDDVTYTLTLTNPNAVALNNRLIVDNLANGALAADLATVVVTPATALVGAPAIVDGRLELVVNIPATGVTVTFEAEVLQPGTVTNLGSVYGPPVYVPGDNGEPGDYERPNVPEDTDEEPVDVEQLLPPVMAKTSEYTAPLRVGDDVTYTLTLTNPNAVALNNRLIVDNLANGALVADLATVVVTPATALVGTPQLVDGRLELVVNIPATGVTVTFEAEVLQPGTVTNLGSVYGPPVYVPGDNGEPGDYERPDEPEDTDEEPVDVEQLLPPVMAKTSSYTAPLRVGDDVTYTLTLTNPNAVALNNRLIVDNLANGALVADLATVVVTPATALVGTPQLVDGRLELVVNIPANGVTVTFEAEVLQPGTVTNLGSVYGPPVYVPGDNGEPGDYERPDEPEDTDEEPVDVEQPSTFEPEPGVEIVKSTNVPADTAVRVGDTVTYTIRVTNTGNVALTDLVVLDPLPIHLTNPRVLALPAEAVGGFAENTLRVELASLAPGAYVEITFVAMVAAGTPAGPLVNEATVRSEMHDRDDTDTATVTVENPFSPYHNSFIIGRPTGNIYPRDNITRSEVAAVFFRLLSDDFRIEMWSQENPFPDVTGDRWFNNEVSTITNAGVIHGLPDGTFGPARAITRAEVTAIVARFFNEQEDIEEEVFTDITGHWAEGYINSLAHFGWIEGPGDGTFRPNQLLTRAEFAAIINRMLNRLPEDIGALLDGRTRWPDKTNPNAWYYLYLQEASHSTEFERLENGYLTWTAILPHIDWSLLSRPDSRPDDIMVARNR